MTRNTMLLAVLGAVLVVVLWYLFLFKPANDELAEVNTEIQTAQDQQQQLETQLERLRDIRQDVTSIEAELAAYNTVITPDPGLPSLLRQLQTAANDSALELLAVAPGEPAVLEEVPDLQSISLAVEVSGGYYQLVDFLRRIEDPVIVGRGVLIDGLQVTLDEYPTLSVSITARIFTTGEFGIVPQAPDEVPNPSADTNGTEAPTPGATEGVAETESPAALAPQEVAS